MLAATRNQLHLRPLMGAVQHDDGVAGLFQISLSNVVIVRPEALDSPEVTEGRDVEGDSCTTGSRAS
jgi:hypothetical protein